MNRTVLAVSATSLFAIFMTGSNAYAEYRCDSPKSFFDVRACTAAEEGPDALRRVIWSARVIESLYFADYVNRSTLEAWEQAQAIEVERTRQAKFEVTPVARAPASERAARAIGEKEAGRP